MLRFRSLASGSAGNATLVEARSGGRCTRVLVDCGLSWRQLLRALAADGLRPEDLDAVFITHEHGDHTGCALPLARRHPVPLWMSAGTREAMGAGQESGLDVRLAADGVAIAIGDLELQPFTVPHDAREPLQLVCTDGDRRLAILTDLGHATPHVLERLQGSHALLLESNHDSGMLAASSYPAFLKRRIGGALGHLNNEQAAGILEHARHGALRHVVAAHLSERNNEPALVQHSLAAVLNASADDILVATRSGLGWLEV